jgi:K+ transporter
VLLVLFWFQSHGTERVGRIFGPVMVLWFLTIAVLGVVQIVRNPQVLYALNPCTRCSSSCTTACTPGWRWARWCWR